LCASLNDIYNYLSLVFNKCESTCAGTLIHKMVPQSENVGVMILSVTDLNFEIFSKTLNLKIGIKKQKKKSEI
jgi:hypothetical protein